MKKQILFVCTGNTCRSLMAEAGLKKLLEQNAQLKDVVVNSAGIAAAVGGSIPLFTRQMLESQGIGIPKEFEITQLTQEMIKWANLILTMENHHKQWIYRYCPSVDVNKKVFTLKEYVNLPGVEIMDPMGGSRESYETCFLEINKCLSVLIERLKNDEDSHR